MGKKLVAAHSLAVGHVLVEKDIAMKSPGGGLHPYEMENIIGKIVKQHLNEDDTILFENLE